MSMLLAFAFRLSIQTFVPPPPRPNRIYIYPRYVTFLSFPAACFVVPRDFVCFDPAIEIRSAKVARAHDRITRPLRSSGSSVSVLTNAEEKNRAPCRVTSRSNNVSHWESSQTRIHEDHNDPLSILALLSLHRRRYSRRKGRSSQATLLSYVPLFRAQQAEIIIREL